jgi:hypothetical protein
MRHLHTLLARREQPRRIILVAAALPLIFTAFVGAEYGAFAPYAVLASICLGQAIYPTLLGWALVVGIYAVGSLVYLFALIRGLIELAHGDGTDAFAVAMIAALLLAIDTALLYHRPKPIPEA